MKRLDKLACKCDGKDVKSNSIVLKIAIFIKIKGAN